MFVNKAYIYSVFLFLCFLLLPHRIWASSAIGNNSQDKPHTEQNDHNKDESGINEDIFMQWMDEVAEGLQQVDSNNLVLFFGPTGAGKSTTICSLLFGKLDQVKKDIFFEENLVDTVYNIDVKNAAGKNHPKIGHKSAVSCTFVPACYSLKGHHLDLCDFAGLFDSEGIEKRTAIAIASKQFLERSEDIKAIVFVMSQSDLDAVRTHIINQVIAGLTKMFANPLDHVDSIFFALTKSKKKPGKFRYIISELKDRIKQKKDKSGVSNSKTAYDLLNTMLTKHKDHFLLVNPLKEESSKLIIASLKKSKGFPSKAIRFIGDESINRASRLFFTKCAKEGIEILDICNTYPKEIKEKTKEISDLDFKILETAQAIQENENEKNKKNTFENLLKGLKSDMVQAKADITFLREEKSAKEKYIRDYNIPTLVEVGSKNVSKAEMTFVNPWFGYKYRIIDISVIPDNGSYCDVKLDFDKKNGYMVKESKLDNEYKATYRCYEDSGSDLKVTLLEYSAVRYSTEIQQALERVKELKESEIQDKKIDIAVLIGKISLVENFLITGLAPPKFNIVEELEARKKKQEKERSSLQTKLKEMKQELTDKEKALFRKGKLFKKIEETHGFLGFTYGQIADFVREYRNSSSRVRKVIKKIESAKSTSILLTVGYIRESIKALPQRGNIEYRASDTICHLVLAYYFGH